MEKFMYKGSNKKSRIASYAWLPKDKIKGLVYFAHGVTEYAERHERLFKFLTENGYLVVANDHMGHGNSQGEYPMFFDGDDILTGWEYACFDAYRCVEKAKSTFKIGKKTPVYGMGFSLGSFIIRTVAIKHPDLFTGGLILLGTGYQSSIKTTLGKIVAKNECRRFREIDSTPQISKLTFDTYNKHFEQETRADWLCANKEALNEYLSDNRCGEGFTAGLFYDLLWGMEYTGKTKNIKEMNKEIPVLLLSGTKDAVGDFGKGVETLHKKFSKLGIKSTYISYENMRHDILHEVEYEKVHQDILNFLSKQEFAD